MRSGVDSREEIHMLTTTRTSKIRTLALAALVAVTAAGTTASGATRRGWTAAQSMTAHRTDHRAILLVDGRILVVGGSDTAPLTSAELYTPSGDSWQTAAPMQEARAEFVAVRLN